MRKILLLIVGLVVVIIVGGIARRSMTPDSATIEGVPVLTPEEQAEAALDARAVSTARIAERYKHPRIGFSFDKPEGYTIGALRSDELTETLVVQPVSGEVKKGFQIVVTKLDEPVELSPNLIKQELPGTSVNNAQAILLDSKGKGMMFASNNDAFDSKSFEIWFVADGYLYQATSYVGFADQLKSIIGTWRF